MPLLLLIPLLVIGLFGLWVLLLPLSIFQRYRFGKARRRVQPWFVRVNAWLLAVSAAAFILFSWVASNWIAGALLDAVAGLAVGGLIGAVGLAVDRFEWTSQGMFRTPNRWLVLALALLVAGRIVLGFWLAWSDGPATGVAAWATRGGLIGIGGLLLGYALATAWGLRHRISRRLRVTSSRVVRPH
jgi:hypothetical protein